MVRVSWREAGEDELRRLVEQQVELLPHVTRGCTRMLGTAQGVAIALLAAGLIWLTCAILLPELLPLMPGVSLLLIVIGVAWGRLRGGMMRKSIDEVPRYFVEHQLAELRRRRWIATVEADVGGAITVSDPELNAHAWILDVGGAELLLLRADRCRELDPARFPTAHIEVAVLGGHEVVDSSLRGEPLAGVRWARREELTTGCRRLTDLLWCHRFHGTLETWEHDLVAAWPDRSDVGVVGADA